MSSNHSEIETTTESNMETKVPKSESSSSGVNEISDSSNNSFDEYNNRMKEVAERERSGDIPAFKDVMDLMKFGYILQVSRKPNTNLSEIWIIRAKCY